MGLRQAAADKEGRGLFFKIVQAEKQELTRNTLHFAWSLCFSFTSTCRDTAHPQAGVKSHVASAETATHLCALNKTLG